MNWILLAAGAVLLLALVLVVACWALGRAEQLNTEWDEQ